MPVPVAFGVDDYSVNQPSLPPAGLILLITIPANPYRESIEIQNQSGSTIQVVRDDGNATAGTISSILLAGTGGGAQGGGWSSMVFRGRVRVYGMSGAQVTAFQE